MTPVTPEELEKQIFETRNSLQTVSAKLQQVLGVNPHVMARFTSLRQQ